MSDTIFCPNCGERISARARFCPSCGARQDDFRVAPAGEEQERPAPPPDEPIAPPRPSDEPLAPSMPLSALLPAVKPPPAAPEPPTASEPPEPAERASAPPEPAPRAASAPPEPAPPAEAPPLDAPPEPAAPGEPRADDPAYATFIAPPPSRPPTAPPPDIYPGAEPPPAAEAAPPAAEPPAPGGAPPTQRQQVPPREPLRERIGRVDPQAGELSELLRERLALPGIVAAGVAAAAAAGAVLAAGLIIALITPDTWIVGVVGRDAGIITEAFRQAVGTLLTPMIDSGLISRRIHPMLLLAIPLIAVAVATRWQLHRTEGAPPLIRLAWATLVAFPFAVLMLVFAVIGGQTASTGISASAGGAFALGLLWGIVGALIGAATTLPLADDARRAPPLVRRILAGVLAALRPLAAVLVTCTAIGLVGWLVQVGADVDDVRADRSAATALVEAAAYAGEHGVNLTALGAGARFRPDANGALGLPFPVADPNAVPGGDGAFRIFSYDDQLPAYVLLPGLIILMGLVALGALYAGFAAARAVEAGSLATGAAWGAITGPAWAIAMALLVALAGGLFHGDADDASVFGVFLLGGAILGAAGGALALSGQTQTQPAPPAPDSSAPIR